MKYLLLAFVILPLSIRGATYGVSYNSNTRAVLQTDLDFTVDTMAVATTLTLGGVAVVTAARTITAGVGLSGGGDLSANRTFTLDLAELTDNQVLWSGASASRTITFSLSGATDPVLTLGDGVFNISTGTLQQGGTAVVLTSRTVTVAGTANEITSSAGAQDLSANRTWTLSLPTALTFTGKTITGGTFSSPTLGTPTFTGSWTMPDNTRQTFNPGADAAGINVGSHAGDPGTPSNGDLWYSTLANALRARINGSTVSLGAGGGGSAPEGTMVNSGASEQYALPYYVDTTGTNIAPSLLKTDATGTNFYVGGFYINTLFVSNEVQFATNLFVGGSLTITNGNILPAANNTVALGSASLSFADLFLASTAVINFGNGNVTITHASGAITVAGATTFSLGTSAAFTTGTIEIGAASDTTISRGGAGYLLVEGVEVVMPSSTNTFTNKGYDAAGTGNVLKQTKQLILQRPDYGDGAGAVPQTNTYTASGLMHYTFSGNAETNANWAVYEFDCPSDLDTTVAMTARFAYLSGGTDTDDYVFHITYAQNALGAAYSTGTSVSTLPIVMTSTPTTPANGDLQSTGAVTLTGWAAALSPGRAMQVRVARLQNSQDDGARDVQLVITYGSTL